MSDHNINVFTPFPRYENAVIIGDTATEVLSQLKIYGKALIGGEIPSQELRHPAEKPLECTVCVNNDKKLLLTAMRRGEIDYIVVENNPRACPNPFDMKAELEALGMIVKVLDVSKGVEASLIEAGKLFGEEKRAERAIRNYQAKMQRALDLPAPKPLKVLALLCIRHPTTEDTYSFAITESSDLFQEILNPLGLQNAFKGKDDPMGMRGISEPFDFSAINDINADLIALCGDTTALMEQISKAKTKDTSCPAIQNLKLFPLPYYCAALETEKPDILFLWKQAALNV